jgi:hypothetical protein
MGNNKTNELNEADLKQVTGGVDEPYSRSDGTHCPKHYTAAAFAAFQTDCSKCSCHDGVSQGNILGESCELFMLQRHRINGNSFSAPLDRLD